MHICKLIKSNKRYPEAKNTHLRLFHRTQARNISFSTRNVKLIEKGKYLWGLISKNCVLFVDGLPHLNIQSIGGWKCPWIFNRQVTKVKKVKKVKKAENAVNPLGVKNITNVEKNACFIYYFEEIIFAQIFLCVHWFVLLFIIKKKVLYLMHCHCK